MRPATRLLHETLLRAAKMMVAAWEKWLAQTPNTPAAGSGG